MNQSISNIPIPAGLSDKGITTGINPLFAPGETIFSPVKCTFLDEGILFILASV